MKYLRKSAARARDFIIYLFIILVDVFRGSRPLPVGSIAFSPVVRQIIMVMGVCGRSDCVPQVRKQEAKMEKSGEEDGKDEEQRISFSGMFFQQGPPS